jgi:hypothetical protein
MTGNPWHSSPEVRSPVGRPLADQLEAGERRQDLPGFEPCYRDFVDYIIRCTHRIWEEKNVGLCRTHYSPGCVMHTMAGPTVGSENVVQGTIGALAMSADRQVIGEDVIWSHDEDGRFYSSHRITSQMTHTGDDPMLGPGTGRLTGVNTIADCACVNNLIVEEWLVRDNARAVAQVGRSPWEVAAEQAAADRLGDPARHQWRAADIADVRSGPDVEIAPDHPARLPAAALSLALREHLYGDAAEALSVAVESRWPTNRHGFGRGYWIGCAMQLNAALHETSLRIEHAAARPLPGDDMAVALRWRLAGVHGGYGPWGPPTGREILILAVSHYRIRGGKIVEDVTVFDELAALRQVAGGLGA